MKLILILIFSILSSAIYSADLKDDYLKATDDGARVSSLEEMGKSGEQKYQKTLLDALVKGESSKVRVAAASSLGLLKQGVNELQKAYDNDDIYVREASLDALAEIGNSKSQSYFEKGVKDSKSEKIRFSAIKGLSKVGRIGNASLFRNALDWKDKNTQIYAIRGIGNIGAYDEWSFVKPFCANADKDFVIACLYTAGKIQYNEALLEIERLLPSADGDISKAAFEATGFYKAPQVIPTLIRFKRDNPNHASGDALSAALKKLKAAKQYAIVKPDKINVREKGNDTSSIVTSLKKGSVVEILAREPRKFIVTTASGDQEDFWYQVKTDEGKKGFMFGFFIDVIDSK